MKWALWSKCRGNNGFHYKKKLCHHTLAISKSKALEVSHRQTYKPVLNFSPFPLSKAASLVASLFLEPIFCDKMQLKHDAVFLRRGVRGAGWEGQPPKLLSGDSGRPRRDINLSFSVCIFLHTKRRGPSPLKAPRSARTGRRADHCSDAIPYTREVPRRTFLRFWKGNKTHTTEL